MQGKIVHKLNESPVYIIIADETTDISTTEQMTLLVRYVNENSIKEDFLTFIEIKDLRGKARAETIVKTLSNFDIPLSKLRGQGYDGAAAMSGNNEGVQAHIRKLAPLAVYTHCACHCLNLAISKCTSIPTIRNMYGILAQLVAFFSCSALQKERLKTMNPF